MHCSTVRVDNDFAITLWSLDSIQLPLIRRSRRHSSIGLGRGGISVLITGFILQTFLAAQSSLDKGRVLPEARGFKKEYYSQANSRNILRNVLDNF